MRILILTADWCAKQTDEALRWTLALAEAKGWEVLVR